MTDEKRGRTEEPDVAELVKDAALRVDSSGERALAMVLRGYVSMGLVPAESGSCPWERLPRERQDRWRMFARAVLTATDRMALERSLSARVVEAVLAELHVTDSGFIDYDRQGVMLIVQKLLREVTG